jgi:hypothetical protein
MNARKHASIRDAHAPRVARRVHRSSVRLGVPFVCLILVACSSGSLAETPAPSSGSGTDQSAHLQLRPVLFVAAPNRPAWKQLEPVCTETSCPGAVIDPNEIVIAQNDKRVRYRLGPTVATEANISDVSVTDTGDLTGWSVDVQLDAAGTTAMATATRAAVMQPDPTNMMAILLDGVVVSAPVVQEPIESGRFSFTGAFSESEAADIADRLSPLG